MNRINALLAGMVASIVSLGGAVVALVFQAYTIAALALVPGAVYIIVVVCWTGVLAVKLLAGRLSTPTEVEA